MALDSENTSNEAELAAENAKQPVTVTIKVGEPKITITADDGPMRHISREEFERMESGP